jgi:hypothetical protein
MVPCIDARSGTWRAFARAVAAFSLRIGGIGALFGAACAHDSGANSGPSSGQTGDEGSRTVRARCSRSENFGPGEVFRTYTCAYQVADPTWRQGDATPAGNYTCICSGSAAETIVSANCTDALATACGVDLAAPTPCSDGEAACWPVRDQPDTWRCQCDADAPISENLVAARCLSAMAEVCVAAIEPTCDAATIVDAQSTSPDAGQPLPDMECGSPP